MMTDRLTPDDLLALTACQKRARRAEIELRAAQATLDLLLLNLQEAHGLGPGDKLAPNGAILRAGGQA
jgi:hypothetical protein